MCSLKLPEQPLQPFNVLAFDPGGTTGWAQAILRSPIDMDSVEYGEKLELHHIELRTGEWGPEEHHRWVYGFIGDMYHEGKNDLGIPLEIVSEPFHYRQNVVGEDAAGFRGKVELISAEYIGVIKLACAQLGLSYYDRFTPGEAKRYVPNTKLEALGWLQEPVTPMRHRNDALRQLVKYLIVKKKVRHPITTTWRQEQK